MTTDKPDRCPEYDLNHSRVVMFSGGIGSWGAAKRVTEQHGTDGLILLFSDTLMEDWDLYRFLEEAARNVGGELVRIAEGRDVWQVFHDSRFLGNTRADPCSRILKRELARKWVEANCEPDNTILYVGIDWTEEHRLTNVKKAWAPWEVRAPLCEEPLLEKGHLFTALMTNGLKPPRLYDMGFPHNNCGGFCVKAGHAHFQLLLEKLPARYREHERKEQALREYLGKDVAILRDRTGGKVRPLTLKEFRESLCKDKAPAFFDADEWGGCGCFADNDA